jgi:hypothetical protein
VVRSAINRSPGWQGSVGVVAEDDVALVPHHRGRAATPGDLSRHGVDVLVGTRGGVVDEDQATDACLGGEPTDLTESGVAVGVGGLTLGVVEHGAVAQYVDLAGQLQARFLVDRRMMVGQVGQALADGLDAEPERPPALVGDLHCGDLTSAGGERTGSDRLEAPLAAQPLGADREVGR